MTVFFDVIFLLVGFFLLIQGANYFVDGSCAVAEKLHIPTVVVGLTIVAIGTSLPELAVSTFASAKGSNAMALGNVIGSNIFNILMVLGISALFINVNVKKSILKREFPFLMIITLLTIFLTGDALWFGGIFGKVNIFNWEYGNETIGSVERIDGILLFLLFVGFLWWTVSYALNERNKSVEDDVSQGAETISNIKCAVFILGGATAIVIGGEVVVDCAKSIALAAGMSETLVGLTIVALGTSLPELVTSAVAAKKGEADIAVGNVVGSNIANILLVLGMSAAISPVSVSVMSFIDTIISLVVTVIVFGCSLTRRKIKKSEGVFLILIYGGYLAYIICR